MSFFFLFFLNFKFSKKNLNFDQLIVLLDKNFFYNSVEKINSFLNLKINASSENL